MSKSPLNTVRPMTYSYKVRHFKGCLLDLQNFFDLDQSPLCTDSSWELSSLCLWVWSPVCWTTWFPIFWFCFPCGGAQLLLDFWERMRMKDAMFFEYLSISSHFLDSLIWVGDFWLPFFRISKALFLFVPYISALL